MARAAMWRAYWANPGSKDAHKLAVSHRLALLRRAVAPSFSFRCSRWPPQCQVASELDCLQQKMTASLLKLPRDEGEEADAYVRRRGRAARKLCVANGKWSALWFRRAVQWDEHLARPLNSNSWAAKLRMYRGRSWLMEQRSKFAPSVASLASPASMLAGRTGTRAQAGKVHMRFHDGIEYARTNS